jgi:tRNA G18 (ribose-2'-O)-methylase SpoU
MSYNVHDNLKDLSIEELKNYADRDRLNFSVCLLHLEHDLNIGNCIRTAHIMGASRVFIFGKRRYDLRSTVGANHYTNIIKVEVEDLNDFNSLTYAFKHVLVDSYKLFPMMVDKTPISQPISKIPSYKAYDSQLCLIFGNEQAGIPECILNLSSHHYHIEQRGVMRSLNVASAAAIAMYALTSNS